MRSELLLPLLLTPSLLPPVTLALPSSTSARTLLRLCRDGARCCWTGRWKLDGPDRAGRKQAAMLACSTSSVIEALAIAARDLSRSGPR